MGGTIVSVGKSDVTEASIWAVYGVAAKPDVTSMLLSTCSVNGGSSLVLVPPNGGTLISVWANGAEMVISVVGVVVFTMGRYNWGNAQATDATKAIVRAPKRSMAIIMID